MQSVWSIHFFSVERIQKEYDEFAVESQQLDKEYEATIDQNEKKIKELTLANTKAQGELESLRVSCEPSVIFACYLNNTIFRGN